LRLRHVPREQKRKNDACRQAKHLGCKDDETRVLNPNLVFGQASSLLSCTNHEEPSGLKTFASPRALEEMRENPQLFFDIEKRLVPYLNPATAPTMILKAIAS
jgi:hypothetical protein